MSQRIRVGLIGTGWATHFHLPAFQSHPAAEVTAICARDRSRAERVAADHGVGQVFTDYREMIANGSLDAVSVVSPEDLHHPMTMAALDAGLHVLCEKPMAFSAGQTAEMLSAAQAAGVKHMVQFTNRGLPHYRYLKDLLAEGYVGQPYVGSFSWPTGWGPAQETNPYFWPADARRSTGAVNELGSHMLDLARWYLGKVVRVSASTRVFVERLGPEGESMENANDSACLLLDFANGAHGVVHVGLPNIAGPGLQHTGQTVIIQGSEGTLESRCDPWLDPAQTPVSQIVGLRRGSDRAESLPVPNSYFVGADPTRSFDVFEHQPIGPRLFIDAIRNDLPIEPSFHDGHAVQRIVDAALESARTGQAQTL